jgi:hypothetical protein
MEPTVVEPVDPFQRGKLQIVEVTRKIAFCESNPGDLHCEGFDVDALFNPDEIDFGSSTPWAGHGGDGGDGDKRPGLDFTEGDPKQRDEELKKLCDANPSDSLCAGITGGDSSSTKDDGGQTDTKDDSGTKDNGDGQTGTKADGGGDSGGTTDDGGGHTGTKDGGK